MVSPYRAFESAAPDLCVRHRPRPGRPKPREGAMSATRDVYICDFVRTPIGRYGGALAKVRADDLAAVPLAALAARHHTLKEGVEEVFLGCANQAGEDNRNVARMACCSPACPRPCGPDPEPAVRVGPRRGRRRRPGDPGRRPRPRAGRRGRVDDPGAVRDGQGRRAVAAPGGDPRHHDRLALRQPGAQAPVRRRFDARDRRGRRRRVRHLPRRPGRLRPALAAAGGPRPGRGDLRRGDRRGRDPRPQGRPRQGRARRASARPTPPRRC